MCAVTVDRLEEVVNAQKPDAERNHELTRSCGPERSRAHEEKACGPRQRARPGLLVLLDEA